MLQKTQPLMNHIEEQVLELYVLGSAKVETQRDLITTHLQKCEGCSTLVAEMKSYYLEVEQIQTERQEHQQQALTLRGLIMKVPQHENTSVSHVLPSTLPARVVFFVIRHYAVTSLSFFSLVIGLFMFLYFPKSEPPKDYNPSYARAKDEFLVAYNKSGEEVWRKHVGTGFDVYLAKWPLNRRAIFTADGNNDGHNEVFCIYGDNPSLPFTGAVVCYDWDGRERWIYEFHKTMQFGDEVFTDNYFVNSMLVSDFDNNGYLEIIAEAGHERRYPNVVLRLDARDGKLMNEYWHAGNIEYMAVKDIDGDGVQEIFLTNSSTFYGATPIIVLDPRYMDGYAPLPDSNIPIGISPGTEKYYILLPRSGVEKSSNFLSTAGEVLYFKSDGLLETIMYDRFKDGTSFALNFYFDTLMQCVNLYASEPNLFFYRKLEHEELSLKKIDTSYLEDMKRSVRYWDGEQFINEPTMNKRYVAVSQRLP
ncbi:MAG: VCBS repeat-containing protein [Ignavibacteriae bacterium]|nr:VCBS repeat-containing protein [Ignavibacteriota bacterium]